MCYNKVMKKNVLKCLLAIGLLFSGFLGFAQEYDLYKEAPQEIRELIQKADNLIEKKQYASALAAISSESNEFIIYKQVEIYTKYFVQSIMHQMFVVKDLEKGEDLMELRKNLQGDFNITMFDAESIIEEFKAENGEKPILDLALGVFYYDTLSRYGDQWLKSADELISLAEKYYKKAYDAGYYDIYSLFDLGTMAISNKDYETSEKYFLQDSEIDPENPSVWFNIAVARMSMGNLEEAIEPAKKAISLETNEDWLADEYFLLTDAYVYTDDIENAIKNTTGGKKKFKNNPEFALTLGQIYLLYENDYAKAEKEYIEAAKIDGTSITQAVNHVANTGNWNNLKSLCLKALKLHPKDNLYTGYVEFILSQAYMLTDDKANALKEIKKARALFEKAGVLDGYIEAIEEIESLCQ